MKRIFLLFSFFLIIVGGVFFLSSDNKFSITQENPEGILEKQSLSESISASPPLPENLDNSDIEGSKNEDIKEISAEEKEILPSKFKLDVSFTSQAPFTVWDFDHDNACEEAAILIVHYFWQKKELTPEIADKEILEMIEYQKKNWGGHFDLEAEETAKLAKEFYGYENIEIKYDISIEDIKKEIFAGNPVILPTAGRLLGNPYYRQPGPLYHMLVAIGFDDGKGEMIVNDPGTKRGENFVYKYDVLEKAIHDWNEGKVEDGKKAMIVIR